MTDKTPTPITDSKVFTRLGVDTVDPDDMRALERQLAFAEHTIGVEVQAREIAERQLAECREELEKLKAFTAEMGADRFSSKHGYTLFDFLKLWHEQQKERADKAERNLAECREKLAEAEKQIAPVPRSVVIDRLRERAEKAEAERDALKHDIARYVEHNTNLIAERDSAFEMAAQIVEAFYRHGWQRCVQEIRALKAPEQSPVCPTCHSTKSDDLTPCSNSFHIQPTNAAGKVTTVEQASSADAAKSEVALSPAATSSAIPKAPTPFLVHLLPGSRQRAVWVEDYNQLRAVALELERDARQPGVSEGYVLVPREPNDAWSERFCEAVNWHPDGTENKFVEGQLHSVTFRELAKGYIRAMLAAAESGGKEKP